jgi:hypothetical protein
MTPPYETDLLPFGPRCHYLSVLTHAHYDQISINYCQVLENILPSYLHARNCCSVNRRPAVRTASSLLPQAQILYGNDYLLWLRHGEDMRDVYNQRCVMGGSSNCYILDDFLRFILLLASSSSSSTTQSSGQRPLIEKPRVRQ